MWRERKEKQNMASDDAPIAYPKARSIIYTIFSTTLAMICSELLYYVPVHRYVSRLRFLSIQYSGNIRKCTLSGMHLLSSTCLHH